MVQQHANIDSGLPIFVNFIEFTPNGLNFLVFAPTKTTDLATFRDIQQDIFYKIITIIESNKANLASTSPILQIRNSQGVASSSYENSSY
jgi:MscS family membrane protein